MRKRFSNLIFFLTHPIIKYYSSHPLVLINNRLILYKLWINKLIKRDINFNDNIYSDIPIDIVIPATDKDSNVLVHVIKSIRDNIKHPIGQIIVISPKSDTIKRVCKDNKCLNIDENTVLPITKKDIKYTPAGEDRSGWLFQQLLKWGCDKYIKNNYYLIADADTVFCRPQVFIHNNKVIFSVSHQFCHIPYFTTHERLLGVKTKPLINFTAHHSLIKKSSISELKQVIKEHNGVIWYQAIINNIDPNEGSSFSEYTTYGQYVYNNYRNECLLEHWFNISLNRSKLNSISSIVKANTNINKTISFHSYNK